jgi:hypothetical protein
MRQQGLPEEIKQELVFGNGKHSLATAAAKKYCFHIKVACLHCISPQSLRAAPFFGFLSLDGMGLR